MAGIDLSKVFVSNVFVSKVFFFERSWRPLGGGLPYRNPRLE